MQASTLTFREYPSMQLSQRQAFLNKLQSTTTLCDPSVLWISSQKIHGANFSVYCDGKIVRYARRNAFFTSQIPITAAAPYDEYFLESFYDAKSLVKRFHNKLGEVFERLKEKFGNQVVGYTLYGEYFGGNWPSKGEVAAVGPAVQKVLIYSPKYQYLVFDVNVKMKEGEKWLKVTELEEVLKGVVGTVPIHSKGTFQEMMAVDIRRDSCIPQYLGYGIVLGNLIEGMVIRPNETVYLGQKRVIIKKKNKDFLQRDQSTSTLPETIPLPQHLSIPLKSLLSYLNKNRIQSVLSKFPDEKDKQKIADLVVKDILDDSEKDELKIDKDVFEKVKEELTMRANRAVVLYYEEEKKRKRREAKKKRKQKKKEEGKEEEKEGDEEQEEENGDKEEEKEELPKEPNEPKKPKEPVKNEQKSPKTSPS